MTRTFQVQQDYEAQHQAIEAITTAIEAVVPAVQSDPAPYFLIMADATHNEAIHARDLRFPLLFDLLYGITGSAADGVYTNAPADLAPLPDQAGSDYHGSDIVVEPDAIYSPLDPGVPIDRDRLIMIEYNSATQRAQVVPERSAGDFAGTNVIVRGDEPLLSNFSLIAH